MTKEEIIARLNELEAERQEIVAEQGQIDYLSSLMLSDEACRAEEYRHMLSRRQALVNIRARKWEHDIAEVEKEADALAA